MRPSFTPLTENFRQNDIWEAVRGLYRRMSPCVLCPRACGAKRLDGEVGFCRATAEVVLASATVHHGEEPPISGTGGSGTLFFSNCTLRCVYCQNWPISQQGVGQTVTISELADRMLGLEKRGVHNINLVNPTHYWPQIAAATALARGRGLKIPILANTSGFECEATLALLAPVVQIWLPDVKTVRARHAEEICGDRRMGGACWSALKFLVRLAGPLQIDEHGIAVRGVLVRHLLLPGGRSDTATSLRRLRRRYRGRVPVSLMTQYFPAHRAPGHTVFGHRPRPAAQRRAWRLARALRLNRGWRQVNGRH
jgi:putative pyruvate formate lyase activating enzyme